jgi:hypothetical protein
MMFVICMTRLALPWESDKFHRVKQYANDRQIDNVD